jgi:hypothetical protein
VDPANFEEMVMLNLQIKHGKSWRKLMQAQTQTMLDNKLTRDSMNYFK